MYKRELKNVNRALITYSALWFRLIAVAISFPLFSFSPRLFVL